jgi:hypothetical protein
MAYTTIDDPTIYFNTLLYTGNDADDRNITGVGFNPDWVWIKKRNNAAGGVISDTVRGAGKVLYSSETNAEGSESASFVSFDSDGFTISQDAGVGLNVNSHTYVAWNWKAGTSFTNDASSTGIGTIDSSGSVSDAAGFSIVSYTGTGSAGTLKHGLNSVPSMIIVKNRDSATNWYCYHKSLGAGYEILLNSTNASDTTSQWNSTEPTSSVFSLGNSSFTNGSGNSIIAYCFAEKKGYSKFGSYTGNGNADGPFVYTGFRPAWLMIKQSSGAGNDWLIYDNKRDTSNVASTILLANGSGAEATGQSFNFIDLLSNGFKLRGSDARNNGSGGTMIYMAFAESPFVTGASAIPTTAR